MLIVNLVMDVSCPFCLSEHVIFPDKLQSGPESKVLLIIKFSLTNVLFPILYIFYIFDVLLHLAVMFKD